MLLNTEQAATGDPKLTQTTFHFELHANTLEIIFEKDGQKASSEEDSFTPFYQDPSQRILAMKVCKDFDTFIFVVKTEVLFGLARKWGEADLEWGQWRTHVVEVPLGVESDPWVSGSQLFCVCSFMWDEDAWMNVYDFSPRALARYKGAVCDGYENLVLRSVRPSVRGHHLPWDFFTIHFSDGGHDTVAHFVVKTSRSPDLVKT